MRIQSPTITSITSLKGDGAQLTGSFSGSFNTWDGIDGKPDPLLSSSAQIADDISGSLSTAHVNTKVPGLLSGSAQIADNISGSLSATHVNTKVPGLVSGSAQIASDISGSFTDASASIASDIDTLQANVSSNDSDISGLNSYTSSLKSAITVAGSDTTILGNLTVQGTQTQLQTATLNVEDLNITVASGSATAAAANGAGLTVAGAGATLTYASTGDKWVFNKDLDLGSNNLVTTGNVDGRDVSADGLVLDNVASFTASLDTDIKTLSLPASTTISTFGASLVDDADATAAKTTLGLENVTNESKATMFSSPTFTGTVSGVTATHVGLGNVTNESKATMFSSPTFTGTVSGVTATHVGLGTSADVQFDSLGIGTAAPGTTGVIRATNDIVAYYSSDKRLKDNITPLHGALDKVKLMGGYEFDWNTNQEVHEGHDIGVVAQEVQAQYPELVHERDNGYLAVDYVKLTAVLLQAVKELSAKVDELSK